MDNVLKVARVLAFLSLLNLSCTQNIFSDSAIKTTDEARLYQVKQSINKKNYTEAIDTYALISEKERDKRENKVLLASAYAGRGGLDVLELITALNSNASGGTKTIFQMLLYAFKGKTISHYNDIVTAQSQIISGISAQATVRTIDENLFLVFIEFAKIGTLLAAKADSDFDGVRDNYPTFNNCDPSFISNSQAEEVAAALGIIITSLAAAGSKIANTSLATLTSSCTALKDATGGLFDICAIGNPADTAIQNDVVRSFARTLIGENNLSIGLKLREVGTKEVYNPVSLCP